MKEKIFTKDKTSISELIDTEPDPIDMIISGLIPKTSIIIISAPGGTSKSYLCLQLGVSVAINLPFLGKFLPQKSGRVLIISGEDEKGEVHRRLKNILNVDLEGLTEEKKEKVIKKLKTRLRIAFTHQESDFVLYSTRKEVDNADRIIRFCKDQLKYSPDVIIFDNLTVFHDADHNSADLASGMMRTLKKIHQSTSATIILIAHTNKSSQDGSLSSRLAAASVLGSAAFSNNARQVISMTQVTENDNLRFVGNTSSKDVVAMRISKANYGTLNKDILFLERNQDGVLKYIEPKSQDPRIESFNVIVTIKRNPSLNKTALVEKLRQEFKMSKNYATNLIQRLQNEKLIDQKETGTNNSKIFKVIKSGEALFEEVSEMFEDSEAEELEESA